MKPTSYQRFRKTKALDPNTKVLGIPVSQWDSAFTKNFVLYLEPGQRKAREIGYKYDSSKLMTSSENSKESGDVASSLKLFLVK